jgi:hypothetical protein
LTPYSDAEDQEDIDYLDVLIPLSNAMSPDKTDFTPSLLQNVPAVIVRKKFPESWLWENLENELVFICF